MMKKYFLLPLEHSFCSKDVQNAENEGGRLVPDLCLFFKKSLCEVKAGSLQLSYNMFR